ncbi:MAG: head-tail joining protein [Syntrophorhabdaceae bacterium]
MSTFQDMITSDLDNVFLDTDEFAQAITYNSASIKAIVHHGPRRKSADQIVSCDAWLEGVKVSDVATPAYRDTVVIGANTYRVLIDDQTQPEGDGFSWVIDLKKSERPIPGGRR